jgi:bifunctional DNase/RNase
MGESLHKIRIKKVLGPTNTGTAVLLGNDEKTFVMFIGIYEGAAIIRELNGESPARPLTHELLSYVMSGFNVDVKQIITS